MRNDIERAVDTVLSGLTNTPEKKAELVRMAMADAGGRSHRERGPGKRADRVKLRFSLSFGLSHMIVAAVVVVIVMIVPLLIPEQHNRLDTWQSDDEEYYMVQGREKSANGQVAEADYRPPEPGVFPAATLEEARRHYGAGLPVLTWLPEDAAAMEYTVTITEVSRGLFVFHSRAEGIIIYQATEFFEESSVYTYISQDGAGENITLGSGKEIYVTTNDGHTTAAWQEGLVEFLLTGSFTREEAIRMAESVKIE